MTGAENSFYKAAISAAESKTSDQSVGFSSLFFNLHELKKYCIFLC